MKNGQSVSWTFLKRAPTRTPASPASRSHYLMVPWGTHVRLDLPESVDRVPFRKAPGAETYELTFTLDEAASAQAWIEGLRGSGFWEVDPHGKGDRLTFLLVWSHKDFASAVAKDGEDGDRNGGETSPLEEGKQRDKETRIMDSTGGAIWKADSSRKRRLQRGHNEII